MLEVENCSFKRDLLYSGQNEDLSCAYLQCSTVFRINSGQLEVVEGEPRCDYVAQEIKEIGRVLRFHGDLGQEKRWELEASLMSLENEAGRIERGR